MDYVVRKWEAVSTCNKPTCLERENYPSIPVRIVESHTSNPIEGKRWAPTVSTLATIVQLAEQRLCKPCVVGSNPTGGSIL